MQLAYITDIKTLIKFHKENRDSVSPDAVIKRFTELIGEDSEGMFTDYCEEYTEKFVIPVLEGKLNDFDVVRASQKKVEEDFIRRNLVEGCTLLEIGCGPGRIPFTFHRDGRISKIYAFDFCKAMIAKAEELRKRFGVGDNVVFFRADVTNLPPLNLQRPVVATCVYGTYGNIPPHKRPAALANITRNADILLLSVYNARKLGSARDYYSRLDLSNGVHEIADESGERTYFLAPSGFITTWFTEAGLRSELEAAGLEPEIEDTGEMLLARCEIKRK
jgi:precorrin-6B methylase 2